MQPCHFIGEAEISRRGQTAKRVVVEREDVFERTRRGSSVFHGCWKDAAPPPGHQVVWRRLVSQQTHLVLMVRRVVEPSAVLGGDSKRQVRGRVLKMAHGGV